MVIVRSVWWGITGKTLRLAQLCRHFATHTTKTQEPAPAAVQVTLCKTADAYTQQWGLILTVSNMTLQHFATLASPAMRWLTISVLKSILTVCSSMLFKMYARNVEVA